jgi:hypothetical protein
LKRTWRNWKDAKALEEREQLMISAKWLGCCADEELFSIARNAARIVGFYIPYCLMLFAEHVRSNTGWSIVSLPILWLIMICIIIPSKLGRKKIPTM